MKKRKYFHNMTIKPFQLRKLILLIICAFLLATTLCSCSTKTKDFESEAINTIKESGYNVSNLTLTDSNTNAQNNSKTYTYEVNDEGKMYDDIYTIQVTFKKNLFGWKTDGYEETAHKRSIHPSGRWDEYNSIKFLNSSNGTVNIAKYEMFTTKEVNSPYCIVYYSYILENDYCGTEVGDYDNECVTNTYWLFNPEDYSWIAFDKNTLYKTKPIYPGYGGYENRVVGDQYESKTEEEFNSYISDKEFIYGLYSSSYTGDLSNAIQVPQSIIGKKVDNAINELQTLGFGRIDKYYNNPETVKDIFAFDLRNYNTDKESFVGFYFDKGSYLCIFNHDD